MEDEKVKIRKSGFLLILGCLLVLTLGSIVASFKELSPMTNAMEKSTNESVNESSEAASFDEINQMARDYRATPTLESARDLVRTVFDSICIVDIPESEKNGIVNQVATASYNGGSNIPDSNIVATINNMAAIANAPDIAYTNLTQVSVTRKFLNRLIPDVVSASGDMNDIEAFTVFVGLLSQKLDNEDFMVPPDQFSHELGNLTGSEVPGNPIEGGRVDVVEELPETYQMISSINNYLDAKDRLASNDLILMIGIQ